ncbi:MAG TPA: sugar phosphate nucleotidyltransferase [Terriglobales bacterium]|nr:sugar phosphate nucleotidyltransferase [Terriglobales bacterium]
MKTVILCGGKGTRSYPFTDFMPKVMMPLGGTPIVVHLMRIFAAQGFNDFLLAAGHRKEMLYDYFDRRFPEWNVKIIDTGENSDTGERVRRCAPYAGERFFATYGDGLGNVDLHSLLEFHNNSGATATVTSVPLRSQYGTVHFSDDGRVTRFEEKPVVRDYWINAGFFVFERRVFEESNGQNLEQNVLPPLAASGEMYTYLHTGFWKSMDTGKDQQEFESILRRGAAPWMEMAAPRTLADGSVAIRAIAAG